MKKGIGRPLRLRCDLPATLTMAEGLARAVRLLDLSDNGAFLATEEEFHHDDEGALMLDLPGGPPFDVRVRVVRLGASQLEVRDLRVDHITVTRRGVGVEFVELPGDEVTRLADFLDLLDER